MSLINKIDKPLEHALDLIGRVDHRVADELKSIIASGQKLVLTRKTQFFDECQISKRADEYIHHRMREIRTQLVGPLVPMLYRAYLQHRYGRMFKKIGFNPQLVDTIIDLITDNFAKHLVDEVLFPSALKAIGLDVESMRSSFNQSLYVYTYNETLMVEDHSRLCLASIELSPSPPAKRMQKLRRFEPRKRRRRKRRKPVRSQQKRTTQKKEYAGVLSMRSGLRTQANILKADDVVSSQPTQKKNHSPKRAKIDHPDRKPNMALINEVLHLRIPTLKVRTATQHVRMVRKSTLYWMAHKGLTSVKNPCENGRICPPPPGMKYFMNLAFYLESQGRKR